MAHTALTARVRETIRRHRMLSGGETVMAAVSGGPDSTALATVLAEVREDLHLTLHIAHFNHGLRPDAAEDALAVAALSRSLGCAYHEGAEDVRAHAARHGTSIEDAARRLRYAFLASVAHAQHAAAIATGHTRDDQAETVLIRLLRGSGLRGLTGIPPVRPHGDVRVIRPLIETPRAEIEEYLHRRGLAARDDPTNRDLSILRNRVRLVLLPILEGYNPDVRRALVRVADLLREDADTLDALAAPRLEAVLDSAPGAVRIAFEAFASLPVALQRRALLEAVRRMQGKAQPIGFVHIEEARGGLLEGRIGAVWEVPGGVRVVQGPEAIEVTAIASGTGTPEAGVPAEYRLEVPGQVLAPEFDVQLVATEVPADAPGVRARAGQPAADEIIMDGARAGRLLIVRGPRPGDRFRPLGMRGRSKKIADYLVEARVPRTRRRWVPVLTTADGEVLWVVGLRATETARLGPRARAAVRVEARWLRA